MDRIFALYRINEIGIDVASLGAKGGFRLSGREYQDNSSRRL
jgi:hypothetical protein